MDAASDQCHLKIRATYGRNVKPEITNEIRKGNSNDPMIKGAVNV
jgi:hypothetical protein